MSKLLQVREENKRYFSEDYIKGFNDGAKAQYEEDAMTADVVEVRHGRWVRKKNIVGQEITVCSVCGEMKRQATGNYCGMCGAKMDEVSE